MSMDVVREPGRPPDRVLAILRDGPLKGSDNCFVKKDDTVAILPDNLMGAKEERAYTAKLEEERMRIQTHHLHVPGARKAFIESRTKEPRAYHVYRRVGMEGDRPVFKFQRTVNPKQERLKLSEETSEG